MKTGNNETNYTRDGIYKIKKVEPEFSTRMPCNVCRCFVVRLPNFHGIVTSFEQYPRDWNIWYTSAEPENTPLPGKAGKTTPQLSSN